LLKNNKENRYKNYLNGEKYKGATPSIFFLGVGHRWYTSVRALPWIKLNNFFLVMRDTTTTVSSFKNVGNYYYLL
jgi:hypothetical protein